MAFGELEIHPRVTRKIVQMSSFRRLLVIKSASVLLLVFLVCEAHSQIAGKSGPETPAEMAAAIAHAIDMTAPKTPNTPISLESTTSHNNVVEVHYVANEPRLFPHNDAEREQRRLRLGHYFCFNNRISLFRKPGIVIHQIFTTPDNSAPFEFNIDESVCAALIADAKTRAADFNRVQSLDEPKHVPTIAIRPDQTERQ